MRQNTHQQKRLADIAEHRRCIAINPYYPLDEELHFQLLAEECAEMETIIRRLRPLHLGHLITYCPDFRLRFRILLRRIHQSQWYEVAQLIMPSITMDIRHLCEVREKIGRI